MKKTAAIILILTANIIMLAHAVIPHHHHHDDELNPALNQLHTRDYHEHSTPGHQHDRNGDAGKDALILEQEVVLRLSQGKEQLVFGDGGEEFPIFLEIDDPGCIHNAIPYLPILISDASIPLIGHSYTSTIISSSGLRAPPSA